MLATRRPDARPKSRANRPRRGAVPPLRTCLQVDAVMRSKSHSPKPHPTGCVAEAALAQTSSLRLPVPADTFRGAPSIAIGGAYPFSVRARGGTHTDRRVPAHVPALMGQSMTAARARRLLHGNAHADRCAPPGRNAGGGTQWQPD